jgi:hypothetical protein
LRDYDKEPLIIKNRFASIFFAIYVLFSAYIAVFCVVFLSGLIDWSVEGKTWIDIFVEQSEEHSDFLGIFLFLLSGTIGTLCTIFVLIKKPRKIYFKNNTIVTDKWLHELLEVNINNLSEIKQSPYAIFATGNTNTTGKYIITMPFIILIMTSAVTLTILTQIILFFVKTLFRKNIRLTFYPYIILFCENTNKLINISLIDKDVYQDVRQYFIDRARFDIDKADINLNFTNFPELEE